MKFYKSKEWLTLRKKALRRDNNECQLCKAKGKYHNAENVHHMKEVKTDPHLALALDNLQCLCIQCHNEVHDRLDKVQKKKPKFMNEERW
ncbi:HNH endonuclease [Alkalihalobacterium alkalinitrilicum]|uniref:HNH endonuclease n=1 Tax=Alkalihalobacterium alkalinitrilicum TaxID=427920 RepID=UPI000995C090|nr:HNH endonuclease [Alkalihalobacterium alkalinitrilicum]